MQSRRGYSDDIVKRDEEQSIGRKASAVSHVEIYKYIEKSSIDQFILDERDRMLKNLDVFVDLSIITNSQRNELR